jgi:lycopene beta-cyclase
VSAALDADVVIVGAGAAGLSIAVRLARTDLRVLVIDRRDGYARDRTFSFFRNRAHPFEDAITRTYHAIDVIGRVTRVAKRSESHPYQCLPADRFYASALSILARHENVRVELGVTTRAITDLGQRAEVETDRGTLSAAVVLDARGKIERADAVAGDVNWVQHFGGIEVKVERPIFEPAVATLMDFRVSQADGPHFVYVLPTSPREALVEDTFFGEHALAFAAYESNARAYLDARGAGAIEIERRESGAIPMTSATVDRGRGRAVRVGIAGGAAKPSTGYAFSFIQREADAIGAALAHWDPASAPPTLSGVRDRTPLFFDRVFLSYLARHPHDAERVFLSLFSRTPTHQLARFLSEEADAADYAAVMNAVPRAEVLREVVRSRALWLGR